MFGISFFSNKVAKKLTNEFGHDSREVMDFYNTLGMREFKMLCDALRQNGYDATKAAGVFHRLLTVSSDSDAFDELYANTGAVGVIVLAPYKLMIEKMKGIEEGTSEEDPESGSNTDNSGADPYPDATDFERKRGF